MFILYIIQSTKKKRFYIGVTTDLEKRLKEHNDGVSKSTKPYLPWVLIYKEEFLEKTKAYKREFHLKHPKGYLEKKDIINKYQTQLGEVA